MKRHLSYSSEPENCDDYDDCSSPDTVQTSRKKRRGVIEKRRRDRINNCLVELRSLVPAAFEKQGSAKLEKAEILQMTVEHLRYLQNRDPRGFSDPCSPCVNTRAFLDYGIMGFRECTAEIARFMANTQGMDPKDVSRSRLVNHLENVISQKELAVNTALAVNSQINISKVGSPPVSIMSMPSVPTLATSIPYTPLTPPRASPDNLSPLTSFSGTTLGITDSLPHFSVAFPIPTNPIISLAPSTNTASAATIFQTSGFNPTIPATHSILPGSVAKPAPLISGLPRPNAQPPTGIMTSPLTPTSPPNLTVWAEPNNSTHTVPKSATKAMNSSTKAPFRPWADSTTMTTNA